jgi:hypothetical protein
MNLSLASYNPLTQRLGGDAMADQIGDHLVQVKAVVEAVAEGTEVLTGVLVELEGLVGAAEHGFEIAQHRVDPSELRHIARLTAADDHVRVSAPGIDDAGKAGQPVTAHITAWKQVSASPVADRAGAEGRNLVDLDEQRVAFVACGDGRHEGSENQPASGAGQGPLRIAPRCHSD